MNNFYNNPYGPNYMGPTYGANNYQSQRAPNIEYYNYGYTFETGFKCRITTVCNLNPSSEKDSVHVILEFNDPKIVESKS